MELIIIAIFGIVIGSFLNVCIYRVPRGVSVVVDGSHCPYCSARLKVTDLIPVISYVMLKGKCRYCQGIIKMRYVLVELLTGSLYVLLALNLGIDLELFKYLVLFSILIVIFFIDLEHKIIQDPLVGLIIMNAIIWQILYPSISVLDALGGAILGGGLLLIIAIASKGGLGGGDIKLMFALGFYLGVVNTLLVMFLSFITGAIVGLFLIVFKKATGKTAIPFGPYIIVSTLIAVLWGNIFLEYYYAMWK